jgi:hypothetical protein
MSPSGSVRVTRNGQEGASSTIILIDRLNTRPDDQHYANQKIVTFLETRRSQDRLGLKPTPFDVAVQETVDWWRAQQG